MPDKPNILVIWGDDIGITNLSCYSDGLMGYRTPNIDRIAKEGMRFTDSYGEQSCTAGRSSFITGQSVFRTGLSKVGMPGAAIGLQAEDPTIAELLKNHGYATGQFGKNHLGDQNEFLPTVHGFDEFFGNLYHLNAEEDPEDPDYPGRHGFEGFARAVPPAGRAALQGDGKDDPKEHPRWGRVGKQRIQDTGPLDRKRMETCDDEFVDAAADFIQRQHNRRKPFFCWVNTTHMHFRTHTKRREPRPGRPLAVALPRHDGRPRQERRPAPRPARHARDRREHDRHVLDRQRPAHEHVAGRGDDAVPQREEHELGGRVPYPADGALARQDPGGRRLERDRAAPRLAPNLPRGGRRPGRRREAEHGHEAAGKTFKVHIDGYNLLPYLTGEESESPRKGFIYFSDDGDLVALRFDNWKIVFMEQRARGTLELWAEPFVPLRIPKLFNLRTDPFERADVTSNTYWDWYRLQGLHDLCRPGDRGRLPRHVRGLPAAAESGELHDRPGAREDGGRCERGPRLIGLASWRDTPTREAIVSFAETAARDVPPEERIAVFDNDGTLWCEKPMPVELGFILQRLAAMAEADASLRAKQPWQAAVRAGPRLARRRDRQALRGRRQRREGPDGRAAAGVRRP